jgi:hypothetical protein
MVLLRGFTRNRFGASIVIATLAAASASNALAHAARHQPACNRTKGYVEARRLFAKSQELIKSQDYDASLMASHQGILTLGDHYYPNGMIEESDNGLIVSGIEAREGDLLGAARIAAGVLEEHLSDCEKMSRSKRH